MAEDWTDFCVAVAGAGAALAGLILVAMSVNISTILGTPSLTSRAAATVAAMTMVVVTSIAGLIPGQTPASLGWAVGAFALGAVAFGLDSGVRMVHNPPRGSVFGAWVRLLLAVGQHIPLLVGAVLLIAGNLAGLSWIAAGIIAVVIASMGTTWVLMVEIRR